MKTQRAVNVGGKTEKRVVLIEQYFNETQPNMSYKEFEAICKTPFAHMKSKLSTDELFEIRYRYLGRFYPVPSKILWNLKKNQQRFDDGLISQKEYSKTLISLTRYISRNTKLFIRFKEDIKRWIKI